MMTTAAFFNLTALCEVAYGESLMKSWEMHFKRYEGYVKETTNL